MDDFQDLILALPQTAQITQLGRLKSFIALGISISANDLNFIEYRDNKISTLKLRQAC
jgi:hypothetical protein